MYFFQQVYELVFEGSLEKEYMVYSVYVRKSTNYTDIDKTFSFYQCVVTTVYVNHFIASSVSLTV